MVFEYRNSEGSKNYWLSDSTKYFGDIFSYTIDNTCDVRTPRIENNFGNAGNWMINGSSGSLYPGDGNIEVGRTGSSCYNDIPIDLNHRHSILTRLCPSSFSNNNNINMDPFINTPTHSEITQIPSQTPNNLNHFNTNTSQQDWANLPSTARRSISYETLSPNYHQRQSRHRCPRLMCPFTFGRKGDLERHFRTVHCGRFSYSCGVGGCENNKGRGYSRRDKLKEHQWRRHGEVGRGRGRKGGEEGLMGEGSSEMR